MKVQNVRDCGRYKNKRDGRQVNVKQAQRRDNGVSVLYYLFRGRKVIIQWPNMRNDWEPVAVSLPVPEKIEAQK